MRRKKIRLKTESVQSLSVLIHSICYKLHFSIFIFFTRSIFLLLLVFFGLCMVFSLSGVCATRFSILTRCVCLPLPMFDAILTSIQRGCKRKASWLICWLVVLHYVFCPVRRFICSFIYLFIFRRFFLVRTVNFLFFAFANLQS